MYIIGDVHGCLKSLKELIKKIPKEEKIVFTGDLVDRGPNSAEVIDFIIENGYECVKGNHELMMEDYLMNNDKEGIWIYNGGEKTLESYKGDKEKLNKHLLWIQKLPIYLIFNETDEKGRKLCITHAGFNEKNLKLIEKYKQELEVKGIEDRKEKEEFIRLTEFGFMWNRNEPLKNENYFSAFGHTPVHIFKKINPFVEVEEEGALYNKELGFAAVDGGCVFGIELHALEFPSMKVISQRKID